MTGSNLNERFCWTRGFTSTLLPLLQGSRGNMQYLSKLDLSQSGFASSLCHLVRLNTTDSCSFARFHFFNRLKQLVAKLLST